MNVTGMTNDNPETLIVTFPERVPTLATAGFATTVKVLFVELSLRVKESHDPPPEVLTAAVNDGGELFVVLTSTV